MAIFQIYIYGFNDNYYFVNRLTKDSNFIKLVCLIFYKSVFLI
jgi:hypothetical protein